MTEATENAAQDRPMRVRDAAWWTCVAEPGDRRVATLRALLGEEGARGWACAPTRSRLPDEAHVEFSRQEWDRAWASWHPRAEQPFLERELHLLERAGGRLVVPGDDEWPEALDLLGEAAPWALWVRGDRIHHWAISIVGARASTGAGGRIAHEIAAGCSERGLSVVSGGAFGIDVTAHRATLAAGGHTLVVMAGGLSNPYPTAHAELFSRILEASGTIISEVPPSWRPARWRFLGRNRLIAALGRATVVVEAARRSGALATARDAMRMGRPVGAVPGPVTSEMSRGCHDLIRNGAVLVTDAGEAAALAMPIDALREEVLFGEPQPASGIDALPALHQRVWSALPRRAGAPLGQIVRVSGLGESEVLEALAGLELAGWVTSGGGRWRRRT